MPNVARTPDQPHWLGVVFFLIVIVNVMFDAVNLCSRGG